MIQIYNEDCLRTIERLDDASIDCVVTSPPYGGKIHNGYFTAQGNRLYDIHDDSVDVDKYNSLCRVLFTGLGRKLKRTGAVIWNVSYNKANTEGFIRAIMEILDNTDFTIADVACWKKPMAVTIDSPNRMTRICELVFILVRRDGFEDYYCNKCLSSEKDGRKKWCAVFNFVEAKNNDGKQDLNGATFSTEFARHFIELYCRKGGVVYDPFMGTGTTASAARDLGMDCIGSEISAAQCEYARRRLDDLFTQVEIIKE